MKLNREKLKHAAFSWIVTLLLLLSVTWYNLVKKGTFGIIGIIFFVSLVVYFISYLISKNKKK